VSRRRRRRTQQGQPSLAFKFGASALLFSLAAIGAELAARSVELDGPQWRPEARDGVIMVGHPTRLWGMAPGLRDNAGAKATISESGLREPLPDGPRSPGTERVMVLGDSTFFGHGVEDDETLPMQLAASLRDQGTVVEPINGAIPGYSTEQSLLLMEEQGWDLDPTLLVIGNLWSDNNVDGFRDADLLRTASVYNQSVLGRSSFYKLLVAWIDGMRPDSQARMVSWTTTSEWPEAGSRRVPLDQYVRNLDRIVRDARDRGVGAAFIAPANDGLVSQRFRGTAGWDPYFDAQAKVAAWHGLPVIPILGAFQAATRDGDSDLFLDEMHPTALGHRVLGEAVAQGLITSGWPEDRLLGRAEPFDGQGISTEGLNMGAFADASRSPQAQLFASTEPNASRPNRVGSPEGEDQPDWTLTGQVQGGTPPIEVRIVTRDGEPISTITLDAPGSFEASMSGTIANVDVIATDANGRKRRFSVRPGRAEALLIMPVEEPPQRR
jgi:hypothetical protein